MKIILFILALLRLIGCSSLKNTDKINYDEITNTNDSLKTLISNLQNKNNELRILVDNVVIETECGKMISDKIQINYKFHQLYVSKKAAKVYCLPDTTSKVIDTLYFSHYEKSWNSVVVNRETFYNLHSKYRSRCNKKGYLYYKDVVTNDQNVNGNFLIVKKDKDELVQIIKANDNKNSKDRIESIYSFETYHQAWRMVSTVTPALKNIKVLFNYENSLESCPGTRNNEFVAYVKGKGFVKIFQTISEGEAGESYGDNIYFPIKFGNGNVKLVQSSNFDDYINYETGETNALKYPKNIGIPISELVVVVSQEIIPIYKDEHRDTYTKHRITDISKYYRWNGSELKLIKINKKTKIAKPDYQ